MDEPVARLRRSLSALLPLAVIAVYLPGLSGDFLWDDQLLVLQNRLTDSLGRAPEMFRVGLWESARPLAVGEPDYYRPLMLVSLALDRAVAGFSPIVAHLQSLAWHLIATGLLYRLLCRVLEDRESAVLGAALFGLHPVQAESVQWVSARNDPMAGVFLLSCLLLLSEGDRPAWRTSLGGLCALLALLCKESAILSPLLLGLTCQLRGRGWGDRGAWLALLAAIGAYVGLRAAAGVVAPSVPMENLPLAPSALAFFAERLLAPWAAPPILVLQYTPPPPWWALVVLAAGLAGLAWAGGRRARVGLSFAALGFAPSLMGLLYTTEAAGRYLYLPMVGLGLALGAAGRGRRATTAVTAGLIIALTGASAGLLPRWRDDEALFAASLARAPSPYTHGAYAEVLERHGRLDEAAEHHQLAVAPPSPYTRSCDRITAVHLLRGDPERAVKDGGAALSAGCAPSPALMGPLAVAMAMTGRWPEAEQIAAQIQGDHSGKAILVRIGAAARRQDWAPLELALRQAPPGRGPELVRAVSGLLELAGEPAVAAELRSRGAAAGGAGAGADGAPALQSGGG